jgi:hypothetical protein
MKLKILIFSFFLSLNSYSVENTNNHFEVNNILEVSKKINNISKSCGGNKNVLIFLDLDNTLLAMKEPLGSDQWFSRQADILKKGKNHNDYTLRVSNNFYSLLKITKELFLYNGMRPVEEETLTFVKSLQKNGHKVVVLTSRGGVNMEATLREINKNNLDFSKTTIGKGSSEFFLPYGKDSKKKQRKVLFTKGVFMTAGLHKGEMTRVIMKKFKMTSPCIVHVDDHSKHTTNVQNTYKNLKTKAFTFRYGAEDKLVKRFHQGPKSDVNSEWIKFQKSFQAKKGTLIGVKTL